LIPGTGKLATVTKQINSSEFKSKMKTVYVNYASISSIGNIYKKIYSELSINPSHGTTEKNSMAAFGNYFMEEAPNYNAGPGRD
jgi:hypothetical protein